MDPTLRRIGSRIKHHAQSLFKKRVGADGRRYQAHEWTYNPVKLADPNDVSTWPTFSELSESISFHDRPPLDNPKLGLDGLTEHQKHWKQNGFLILDSFLPDDVIDAYVEVRERLNRPGGWSCPVPYVHVPEIRDLCLYKPLVDVLNSLLSDEVVLNLNLTGWVSSQRDWHQDDYLNPGFVNGSYAAVWMALDDIHPDSGPFEFVPGSHLWPTLREDKVRSCLPYEQAQYQGQPGQPGHWCTYSENFVAKACADEIEARKVPTKQFLGKRGDVLIWHSCLVHRGSMPKQPGMRRKSMIAHYSGIKKRLDFHSHNILAHTSGGKYHFSSIPLDL